VNTRCIVVVVASLFNDVALAAGDPAQAAKNLQPGQTRGKVLELVGPPRRIARQILYHRHLEQWVYDQPAGLRLEFNCPRGKEGVLTAILQP
jgi:hypothetical protein